MALAVVLLGSYPVVLDITVLGVALPDIAAELDGPGGLDVDWVVTTYLVAVGTMQPATGWLSDRFGKKQVWLAALALFTVGSLLSGVAPTLPVLVLSRIVQGFGGGALIPTGLALVYELFPPHRRGMMMGVRGVAIMAAPAVGPPLGGWITAAVSWRLIFLLNLPLGVFALVVGSRLLRDDGIRDRRSLHVQGWLLAGAAVVALIVSARNAPDWGLTSARTLGLFALGLLLVVVLVRTSLRQSAPLLEMRMFRVGTFSRAITQESILRVAQFTRLTFLPIELQVIHGLPPDRVGLLLAPSAVGVAATMFVGGWLSDRIGARAPVVAGLSVVTLGFFALSQLTPGTSQTELVAILVLTGLGSGLAIMPTTVAAMNSLPTSYVSQAAAMRAISREIATAIGTAAIAAFVVSRLGAVSPEQVTDVAAVQQTYNLVFAIAGLLSLFALGLAFLLPGRRETRELQAARAQEHAEVVATTGD